MGLRAILQAILVGLLLPQLPITELSPLVPLPLASPLKLGTGFPAVPLTLQVWVGHCGRIHEILKGQWKQQLLLSSPPHHHLHYNRHYRRPHHHHHQEEIDVIKFGICLPLY